MQNKLEEPDENETRSISPKRNWNISLAAAKSASNGMRLIVTYGKNGESQLFLTAPRSPSDETVFAYVTTSRPQLMRKAIWSPTSRWQVTRRITVFWPSIFESQRGIRCKHTWIRSRQGYEDPADTSEALAAGIVPNVVSWSGADTVGVSYECRESEITDTPCQSSKPEDIRICLQAGIIPNVYAGIFVNATIKEASSFTNGDHHTDVEVLCMSPKQMRKKPWKTILYETCNESGLLSCRKDPTAKVPEKDGRIRSSNKLYCKRCTRKCTRVDFKEANFNKNILIMRATSTCSPGNGIPFPYRYRRMKVLKKRFVILPIWMWKNLNSVNACRSILLAQSSEVNSYFPFWREKTRWKPKQHSFTCRTIYGVLSTWSEFRN